MILPPVWWISFVCLSGLSIWHCGGVQVHIREKRQYAMLFQSVVLQCQYSSTSLQTPVVQWWYKSYCRDRTRDAFSFPDSLGLHASQLGSSSHLDCSDSSRTVRIVASGQGSSMTLSDYYKGRDIAIINKADLRIGQLQWGDSGVYICKVVISDDVEGQNEAQVELLVLGKVGPVDDLLPGFDLDIMPEWVFVGVVLLGSLVFFLLVGICWCQCCPHSCCCYVRCCCCPDTCCCPRHLYEAGKAAKSLIHTPIPMHPAYYIPSVPTMLSVAPPSLIDPKMAPTPSVDNHVTADARGYQNQSNKDHNSSKVLYYVEKELAQFNPGKRPCKQSSSMSELSSLHDGEPTFRQSYRQVQKAALPTIADGREQLDLRETLSSQAHRLEQYHYRADRLEGEQQMRWNPRSEHLQRKVFGAPGRTGSLDELEEFALSYDQHRRRGQFRDLDQGRIRDLDYEGEIPDRKTCPRLREDAYRHRDEEAMGDWLDRHQNFYKKNPDRDRERRGNRHSPLPSPKKRRDTGDSELRRSRRGPGGRAYDEAYLNSLLERKVRQGRAGHSEEDGGCHSDTPSKGSSKKSSSCYHSQSPSNRPDDDGEEEDDDSLPPYSERSTELVPRPFSYTRPSQGLGGRTLQDQRVEREKQHKVSTLLSRDSLIV